jgi:hypothetical protein
VLAARFGDRKTIAKLIVVLQYASMSVADTRGIEKTIKNSGRNDESGEGRAVWTNTCENTLLAV